VCGITSFYTQRSNPDGIAVTLACLDPGTLSHVEIRNFDGKNWEFYDQGGIALQSKTHSTNRLASTLHPMRTGASWNWMLYVWYLCVCLSLSSSVLWYETNPVQVGSGIQDKLVLTIVVVGIDSELVLHYGGCHCKNVRWHVQAPTSVVAWKCN
ncbi:hypothetical protein Goari_012699, partial [Gossypium aridum]|nr:hypothetical protein [Gossypium aridum]